MNALDRLAMLRVADVMTRQVVRLPSQSSLLDVARVFVEHDVVAAPVTDQDGHCVGFFSAADFLRRQLKGGQQDGAVDEQSSQLPLADTMSRDLRTISPGAPLIDAARLMCEQHLHRLPVVDDDNQVVGIVSTMDIVAALINAIDEMEASRR